MKPIQITVGGSGAYDPVIGATTYNNPTLAGVEYYIEGPTGLTIPFASYTVLSTGGFTLASGTFQAGQVYWIHQTGIVYATDSNGYSNGFNFGKVISALFGRVGWKQPVQTSVPTLSSNNLLSKSGRYFNDGSFHSLVTLQNIMNTMEGQNLSSTQFNDFLEQAQKSTIMRCLASVFSEKEYREQVLLFERESRMDVPIENTNMFVGYEIDVAPTFDVAVQIDSVTLLFDRDVTFNFYLFKDGKKSPLLIKSVSAVGYEATVVDFSDVVLNYIGGSTKGGKFYFGYFQADLGPARAIWEQTDTWNKTFCFVARPVQSLKAASSYDFDHNNRYWPVMNFGVNMEVSSFTDHTTNIIRKGNLFDNVIGLQMAYQVMEQVLYAVRSNATERILREQVERLGLLQELKGSVPISDVPKSTGLQDRIDNELKKMKASFYPKPKAQTASFYDCN